MESWDISVLVVEDEKILRTIYQKLLTDKFKQLDFAENGLEGFEKYQALQPDLVITDIKMPLMNGLDMVRKIRRINPDARIIIMSAYGESHYFLRAIENGVKGFLLKPVDHSKLLQVTKEQAQEILLRKSILEEERKRKLAEEALRRNEAILQAVSDAAEILLSEGYNDFSVQKVLAKLGSATQVNRVYFFENYELNDTLYTQQKYEWVDRKTSSQIENEELQAVPMNSSGFSRWAEILSKGALIYGNIDDFPLAEQEVLRPQEIISIMAVPVFVKEKWFGFLGFDDCENQRNWSVVESNSLIAAANILGAAIYRSKIELQLLELNAQLEMRVMDRTRDLESEIAERRYAEEMLRDSEEKYRLIFENANDGILLTAHGRIQFMNPKTYDLTGYFPKHVIGKYFTDFIHPDYREMVLDNHFKRLNGEQVSESYDIQITDINGKHKWVEIKSNLISWDDSPAVLTFMTDIHTRKTVESELKQLNQHLEDRVKEELKRREKQQELILQKSRLESLGELSAGIAHEINQPLGGISLSLDNLLYEKANNSLSENYLQQKIDLIFQDIERIRKIIDHVRDFSRDKPTVFHKINLSEVINNTLSFVNRLYIDHSIDLQLAIDTQHVFAWGDAFQLEQVLLNLLSNAKYAVDKKAEKMQDQFQKRITVRTFLDNKRIAIEISDNGIGIPPANLINIFNPFFTTKKADEGTGLGLSISYGIIRGMKGDILAESIENEYTTIKLLLPEHTN